MKRLIALTLLLAPSLAVAGGWSSWATPTQIDVDRGYGVMVYGSFGNPGNCTMPNRFYIPNTNAEYDKMYSAVLAAFSAGNKVRVYIHDCVPVGWYAVQTTTFNRISTGALNIKK